MKAAPAIPGERLGIARADDRRVIERRNEIGDGGHQLEHVAMPGQAGVTRLATLAIGLFPIGDGGKHIGRHGVVDEPDGAVVGIAQRGHQIAEGLFEGVAARRS